MWDLVDFYLLKVDKRNGWAVKSRVLGYKSVWRVECLLEEIV